jgi:hypothetical protein
MKRPAGLGQKNTIGPTAARSRSSKISSRSGSAKSRSQRRGRLTLGRKQPGEAVIESAAVQLTLLP